MCDEFACIIPSNSIILSYIIQLLPRVAAIRLSPPHLTPVLLQIVLTSLRPVPARIKEALRQVRPCLAPVPMGMVATLR